MDRYSPQHDLRGNILFILNVVNFQFGNESWLVWTRKANIQIFECIQRGLEVASRTDKCFQMFLSFI